MEGKLDFRQRVCAVMEGIPKGRVMTYGQVAALCGNPRAARIVGGIAHFGPPELPWHRIVNRNGGLARGYTWGGLEGHKKALEADGITVSDDFTVDITKLFWHPRA